MASETPRRRPSEASRRPSQSSRPAPERASGRSSVPGRSSSTQARGSSARTHATRSGSSRASRPTGRRPVASPTGRPKQAPRKVYRPAHRVPLASSRNRLHLMVGLLVLALLVFGGRAFQLQAYDAQAYAAEAAAKMSRVKTLVPQRGTISDRNGVVLASSQPAVRVVADPLMIARNGIAERQNLTQNQRLRAQRAPGHIAQLLAKHLGGKPADYLPTITDKSKKHYVVLKRQVPAWTYEQLRRDLSSFDADPAFAKMPGLHGITAEDDPIRTYPSGDLAANVVGFMNSEGEGAGGLEYALNTQLTGVPGKESYQTSANGRIPLGNTTLVPAVNGNSYTLTLDSEMQAMASQALSAGIARAGAKNGIAIVMNVKTGELLALSTSPGYDSNRPTEADPSNLGNRALTNPYEPGSVQKVVTMAALADQGLVTPDTRVVVPNRLASGDGKLKDSYEHGTVHMTARGVVANSSNIGTVLLARQMDKNLLRNYLIKFGFGKKTGLGLPGESAGWLPPQNMPDYSRDQIAFGQGLSVNAVQESAAVAAIANGGLYNQPRLIKAAVDGEGNPLSLDNPEPTRVVSPEASAMVLEMMESVITKNPDRELTNYRMAGKTGTAQRVDPTCSCYRGYTASFVGVAPVEDPQILVYVVIDQPTKGTDGSKLALPVAKQVMSLALPRYGVVPSTTKPRKGPLEYEP